MDQENAYRKMAEEWESQGVEPEIYERGEIIYRPGDEDSSLYLIGETGAEEEGKVKLFYLDESGRKLTLMVLGEWEIFGEMALVGEKERSSGAQVLQDARIYEIDKRRFLGHMGYEPRLALTALELFAYKTRIIERKLEDMAFKDIPARLAGELLELAEHHGRQTSEGVQIDFKITHKELAEMIGSVRENVTKALNLFEREGILYKRRYRIVVKDEEKLREKAGKNEY
jgi:CRP/FNR family transcriptional regulator